MPRAPVGGFFRLMFGTLFLGLGLPLLTWVLVTLAKVVWGFNLAMWTAQLAPREWDLDPVTFGNRVINQKLPIGLAGGFLTLLGLGLLVGAPRRLRAKFDRVAARIEFAATPRVGERLQGSIHLEGRAEPGAIYKVELECVEDVSDSMGNQYWQEREVQAVMGSQGQHVPFSFDVPITAPPTLGVASYLRTPTRHAWRIYFGEQGKWLGLTFVVQMEPPLADAGRIRIQRLLWRVFAWALLAYLAVFHALPFLASELSGR